MPVTRSITQSRRGRDEEEERSVPVCSTSTSATTTTTTTTTGTTGVTETTPTDQAELSQATLVPGKTDQPQRAMSVRSSKSVDAKRQQLELQLEAAKQRKEAALAAEDMAQIQLELMQMMEREEEGSVIEEKDRTREVDKWVQKTIPKNPTREVPEKSIHEAPEKKSQEVEKPSVQYQSEESKGTRELADAIVQAIQQKDAKASLPPKYLHELPYYEGNCGEWLAFRTVYEDTAPMFSEVQNMARLRRALKGAARETVKSVLYSTATPEEVMNELRRRYGRPDTLALAEMEKVKILPKLGDGPREVCIFASQLSNCVAAIKGLKKPQYLHSPETLKLIIDKLPSVIRYRWYDYVADHEDEDPSNLVMISKFLNREADRCGVHAITEPTEKGRSTGRLKQVHATSEGFSRSENRANNQEGCPHCGESHKLLDCKGFLQASKQERWNIVKKGKICFKCLISRHRRENCRRPSCKVCHRQHHPLLHEEWPKKDTTDKPEKETNEVVSNVVHTVSSSRAYLKMIPVEIYGPKGKARVLALLDEGSTVSLLDSKVAKVIGATGPEEALALETVGGKKLINQRSMILDLEIRGIHQSGKKKICGVRTIADINLASQQVSEETLRDCKHLEKMTKQLIYKEEKPQMLIGQDNWELIISRYTKKGKTNQPVASFTSLGWVLHGYDGRPSREVRFLSCAHLAPSEENMDKLMREHFSLEALGVEPRRPSTDAEGRAWTLLEEKTRRLQPEGRFESGLLWKNPEEEMPDNYKAATTRLVNIEKKLDRDENLKQEYEKQIHHLLDCGYAEEAPENASSPKKWYLPHFAVSHPLKKKIRIVFDAAAKTEGKALNDALLTGPDLLQSLFGILLRFRQWPVAVVADIKEMFLQIRMNIEDRDSLRFLWRGDNRSQKPREYRMTTVIFGAASSPSTAIFVKNKNASEHQKEYPEAAKAIERNHYMDDYLQSFKTENEASKVAREVDFVHKKAGFELRGWTANRESVLKEITQEPNREKVSIGNQGERTLGLRWMVERDTLGFHADLRRTPREIIDGRIPTKREVTSAVMSTFDPLGLLSPVLIQGKKLIQGIWRSGINWDETIRSEENSKWQEYLENLQRICHLEVPRAVTSSCHEGEIHVFSDASETAYAAAVYWRATEGKDVIVKLLAGKARVTPLKPVTIPRLELQAALLDCRLSRSVIEELDLNVTATTFWTDSSTVLAWIRSDPRTFKPFVAHRLAEIEDSTKPQQWRWVPTAQNPADDATRSIPEGFSSEHRWFIGPDFLKLPEEDWPKQREIKKTLTGEEKEPHVVTTISTEYSAVLPDYARFSSWTRLLRTTARVLQFIDLCRPGMMINATRTIKRDPAWRKIRETKKIAPKEKVNLPQVTRQFIPLEDVYLLRAEKRLLKKIQSESFAAELKALRKDRPIERSSRLRRLDICEEDGLLRLKGRIDAMRGVDRSFKRPVVLCGKHPISRLIIAEYHRKFNHGNHATVMNEIQQRFWILGLRSAVRELAHHCQWCRVKRAVPAKIPTGDLPPERLRHGAYPFTCTAVDYFGPMTVTIGRRHEKRWGALFTCLTTRAIHIELAASLSADSMILALRRMAARRGMPEIIYSDNGTNFVGSNKELQGEFTNLKANDILAKTEEIGVRWKFIPPGAPNMGGAWERMVRSVKTALATTLRERAPKEEVLHTLLLEAEHLVNSRPLTDIGDEDTEEALTPNHFLIGRSCGAHRLGTFTDEDIDGRQALSSTLHSTAPSRPFLESLGQGISADTTT